MPLDAGRQLGPYEVVSAIGAGGMGEVYKAGVIATRTVDAVMIDTSENFLGPPGRPDGAGLHASIASAESQRVTSPRRTRVRSYSGQFPT